MNNTRENTEIISVEINPNKVLIKYATYENDILTNNKVEFQTKQKPIHADFRKAVEVMNVHLHGVFELADSLLESISVFGIEIQQKNRMDAVKIMGKYCLKSKNITNIKTDFILLEDDEPVYNYEGHEEIKDDTNIVREEAFRYLFENKQAQLSIPFPKDEEAAVESKEIIDNF